MTYQVLVMPTAKRNLQHILQWVAERSSQGASRLLTAFEDRLNDLSTRPEAFGIAPEGSLVNEEAANSTSKRRVAVATVACFAWSTRPSKSFTSVGRDRTSFPPTN